MANLRNLVHGLFDAAVQAADPADAVQKALLAKPLPNLTDGRIILLAIGKAASAMMRAAMQHVPEGVEADALVVTTRENAQEISGAMVIAAGHPIPDTNGLKAGQMVLEQLDTAREGDFVLCMISGGGSALLVAPRAGLTLSDKIRTNEILLANGFDIVETNLVRQQLSQLKGGGITRIARPASVRSLIISDVVGDDLRAIASGPTASQLGTWEEAAALLRGRSVWEALPKRVQVVLSDNDAPKADVFTSADNQLICSNQQSLEAIAQAAVDWQAEIVTNKMQGDVADAAETILNHARAVPSGAQKLLIFGGETTVTLTGSGRGGRNQELALRFALGARDLPGDWLFLSAGTDGRDGPTDAAGGVVDNGTLGRIRDAGMNLDALLANNDSYAALQAAGDLFASGPTGTNVADIQIFIRP